MPCRDYESESNATEDRLRKQNDKLARIACKVMDLLEELGKEDFLLIKDKEVRDWWEQHKIADAKAAAEKAEHAKFIAEAEDKLGKACLSCPGTYEMCGSADSNTVRCDTCYITGPRYVKK